MPRRYHFYNIAIGGGLIAIVVGLVAVASLVQYSHELDRQLRRFESANSQFHENKSSDAGSNVTHGPASTDANSEIASDTSHTNRDTDRFQKDDLDAQRSMADSAIKMLYATWVQVGLSLVGVLLVIHSMGQTRRAVEIAEKTRIDADTQARQQLRAYVGVESVGHQIGALPGDDYFIVSAKNYGTTPAYDVEIHGRALALPGLSRPQEGFFDHLPTKVVSEAVPRPFIPKAILTPTQTTSIGNRHPQLHEMLESARAERSTVYVYGSIFYRDIFRQPWRTKFCYVFQTNKVPSAGFVPFEEYNGEDNESA
jgi:hypothetical protein